jgi:hypothetical protein
VEGLAQASSLVDRVSLVVEGLLMAGPRKQAEIRSEPFNRLTRIANDLGAVLEAHPDHLPGDQAIIVIEDNNDVGTMLLGYTDTADVITTILYLLKSILVSIGKKMQVQFDGEELMDL